MLSADQPQQITSEIFVGREEELERFGLILNAETLLNILNIHTHGDGGVGKTQLLLRMQKYCREELPNRVIWASELIDFYDTQSRTKLGVMQQITENLGLENFQKFEALRAQYQAGNFDASEREHRLEELEKAIATDYTTFSDRIANENKVIVLFFDTYEVIQNEITVNDQKSAEPTDFSRWIETQLFPHITANTCLVVSGRHPLAEIDTNTLSVETRDLSHFTLEDTKAFWKQCFGITSDDDKELVQKFGSEDLIHTFHTLAGGRPILLALFADWINYEKNPLTPQQLLAEITQNETIFIDTVSTNQKELFEKILVDRVGDEFFNPENIAVTYLAVAYHRMTPEMFQVIAGVPLEESRTILLKTLKPLSFIKYKEGDIVLLHDEMRRLIVKHWWDEQDSAKESRQHIAKQLVEYYETHLLQDDKLSETDRETYMSELIEYVLLADPEDGLKRFGNEFDIAIDDGKYDYSDLLLREAERFDTENLEYLPFPERLHIRLRQIRDYTETHRNYEEAFALAKKTLDENQGKAAWEDSDLLGHFLMAHGSAAFSLEKFEEAVNSFLQAKEKFHEQWEYYWEYRATNWTGYTYYRQGKFKKAEQFLDQSQKGFYQLLERQPELSEQEQRRLLHGLQLSFGNSAVVYGYTGRFEQALRRAVINLNIARGLQHYSREIARACATAGRVSLLAGDMLNARRYLEEAQKRLTGIKDRLIQGRVEPNLAFLQYRVNEFAYLLEYYRAEEIEKLLEDQKEVLSENVEHARTLVNEAIRELQEPTIIKKELADAYYILGELYMVDPSPNHWQNAEKALEKALQWGKRCQFLYIIVDTLESLITLYYFWNGSSGISPKHKEKNRTKRKQYQDELEQLALSDYPELSGKYTITLGDEQFDEALKLLRSQDHTTFDDAIDFLQKAFTHYVSAVKSMKQFNEERHYLALRVFYRRLKTLFTEERERKILKISDKYLRNLRLLWKEESKELDEIYTYIEFLTLPKDKLTEGIALLQNRIQGELQQGNFGLASLFNSCLIERYRLLSPPGNENDKYLEQFLLRFNAQTDYYRTLNDDYQTNRAIGIIRKELKYLKDPYLKKAVEGYTDCRAGTLNYRRGEYGRLLEMFLQEDRDIWRKRFDEAFSGALDTALGLLENGEKKLKEAIDFWKHTLTHTVDDDEKVRLEDLIKRHRKHLGEVKFRLGELLMLNGQFDDTYFDESDKQKGALNYLKEAVEDSEAGEDWYRYDDAVQSYVNALYFAGKYDHPDYIEERQAYERALEDTQRYSTIMGRLRIMQGDVLFSQYFQLRFEDESKNRYRYVLKEKQRVRTIRTMWRRYVEACNFMAQHSSKNFSAAVRVLERRIQVIADIHALQTICQGLSDVWNEQEHLKEKNEELTILIQFASIRSMILRDENNK